MFSIIRTHKHKTIDSVVRSAKHTFREQSTPNAAALLSNKNLSHGCKSSASLQVELKKLLPSSRRRDAVVCIEYLVTASPEAFSRHGGHLNDHGSGYFHSALKWLQKRHGSQNIVSATVHVDETTPHLVVYVAPITADGRLSARDFLGGPAKMRALQDEFHENCGASFRLLRGIKGSKAKHSEISKYYCAITKQQPEAKLSPVDYVAKAVGFETQAWKNAQEISLAQAQGLTINSIERKSLRSRIKSIEQEEEKLVQRQKKLARQEQSLGARERSLSQRESNFSAQEHLVEIANARAEAAERLLELYGQRDRAELSLHRKNIPCRTPSA